MENVELHCLDLEALPEGDELGESGGFDYILSHGVYSWIPPRVRVALLAGVRRHLAPMGVAYVSYNAYPGSYLRDMARDILGYHVRAIDDPQAKLVSRQRAARTLRELGEPAVAAESLEQALTRFAQAGLLQA